MRTLSCLILLAFMSFPAIAAKRVALVVGNDAYEEVPALKKARGDAEAISNHIAAQGFDVIKVLDATRRQMAREFARFTGTLEPGDTAMIFFAGHGVEIDGENYLLPVDIAAPASGGEDFVKLESFALSDLLNGIRATGARTTLAFLDACRDNPFAGVAGRSIGHSRGLARIAAPQGTFVVYSAGAGQQALDALGDTDTNTNSVFTRLLLPKLNTPGLELRKLISELRVEVRNLARTQNHQQFPAYYDELLGDFYFAGAPASQNANPSPAKSDPGTAITNAPATDNSLEAKIRQDFKLASDMQSAVALRAFIDTYQDHDDFTLSLARQMLDDMKETRTAVASNPAPTAENEPRKQDNRRELIRQSQQRLNALGCSAGGADGIAGRKTREAFASFIAHSGAELSPSDLGTALALQQLDQASGVVCQTSTKTKPATAPQTVSQPGNISIAGNWTFKAKCPLFIRTTGSFIVTHFQHNTYKTQTKDSLGQSATGELHMDGLKFSGTDSWNTGIKTSYTGSISTDGKKLTTKTSVGCNVAHSRD